LFSGLLSIENPDRRVEKGSFVIPRTAAASMPTPAAPRLRSSGISVKAPPNECPIIIGGVSSARIVASYESMISSMPRSSIALGVANGEAGNVQNFR
jgi:hypothetical protein